MFFREVQKVVSICKNAALRDIRSSNIDKNEDENVEKNELCQVMMWSIYEKGGTSRQPQPL